MNRRCIHGPVISIANILHGIVAVCRMGLSESLSEIYCTTRVQVLHEDYTMHQSWSRTPHVEGSFPSVAVMSAWTLVLVSPGAP